MSVWPTCTVVYVLKVVSLSIWNWASSPCILLQLILRANSCEFPLALHVYIHLASESSEHDCCSAWITFIHAFILCIRSLIYHVNILWPQCLWIVQTHNHTFGHIHHVHAKHWHTVQCKVVQRSTNCSVPMQITYKLVHKFKNYCSQPNFVLAFSPWRRAHAAAVLWRNIGV